MSQTHANLALNFGIFTQDDLLSLSQCPDCPGAPDEDDLIKHADGCPFLYDLARTARRDHEWFARHPSKADRWRAPSWAERELAIQATDPGLLHGDHDYDISGKVRVTCDAEPGTLLAYLGGLLLEVFGDGSGFATDTPAEAVVAMWVEVVR